MELMKKIIDYLRLFNMIKSLYYSWKWCGMLSAFRFPVLIGYGSRIKVHKDAKIIVDNPSSFKIKIIKANLTLHKNSVIHFGGVFILDTGCRIDVYEGGVAKFGDKFQTNENCIFNIAKRLEFGDSVLFSANALVYDTDLHSIYNMDGDLINQNRDIVVGDNVWFGNRVTILKGTKIGSNIVFGASSFVSGEYLCNNSIYGGFPAKLLTSGIQWGYAPPKSNLK